MRNIKVAATERSPEIDFDFESGHFSIKGESYPEDVSEFYGAMIGELNKYLARLENAEIVVDFSLIYFNSSSAKILMGLFDNLEAVASRGNQVTVNWHYVADDDNMEELGEEFGEDLEHAQFNMLPE